MFYRICRTRNYMDDYCGIQIVSQQELNAIDEKLIIGKEQL